MKIKLNKNQNKAAQLCFILQKKAPRTYFVGGVVRDMLLGKESGDIDIATSLKPEQIKSELKKNKLTLYTVGEKFGTIGVNFKGVHTEITTFRVDEIYEDYRHPKKIKFISDPYHDAQRRDFTINSMFYDPKTKELLDYFHGLDDLKTKKIRFVGDPQKRIKEDALRMIRALRFATTLGFNISNTDLAAIKRNAKLIKKISGERIKQELDKIFSDKNYINGIQLLEKTGLLKELFPEIERLKKVRQSKNVHAEGNVYIHTLLVTKELKEEPLFMRYAGFFHDLGKWKTGKKKTLEGRPHMSFPGHAQKSAAIFSDIAKRLRFSREETEKINWLILHHMDLLHLDKYPKKTLMRWARKPLFTELIKLRIADSKAAYQTDIKGRRVKKDYSDKYALIRKARIWNRKAEKTFVDGHDVMKILKIKTGERVGSVLEKIKVFQMQGRIKNRVQALNYLKKLDTNKT